MKWNSLFEQFLFKILGSKRTSHFTRTCTILKTPGHLSMRVAVTWEVAAQQESSNQICGGKEARMKKAFVAIMRKIITLFSQSSNK